MMLVRGGAYEIIGAVMLISLFFPCFYLPLLSSKLERYFSSKAFTLVNIVSYRLHSLLTQIAHTLRSFIIEDLGVLTLKIGSEGFLLVVLRLG